MKRRLFWKILLGFWLTFFVIIQGVWLLFTVMRSETSDHAHAYATLAVAAAQSAIRGGGLEEFAAEKSHWPHEVRERLRVALAHDAAPAHALADAVVQDPAGSRYRVSYIAGVSGHVFLDVPPEVVIGGAAGGLLFSAILAWYLTQPVQRMRVGFRRLAQGDFATRLGPAMGRRRDEIADLARDFDIMATQLAELLAARDRLLADVSHELRTPLARLNLAIALARQNPEKASSSLTRIGVEAAKLDEMVGELLTLSKLESSPAASEDYFDLAEIAQTVVQDAAYEAAAKSVTLQLDVAGGDGEWIARGNGRLMIRAIENVLRNAIRYSPREAQVHIALHQDGDFHRLVIADQGPGVTEDQLAGMFRPFSLSGDGFGFGLGLAIAQRAIAVHKGTIQAQNRASGGLEIVIMVPAARDLTS